MGKMQRHWVWCASAILIAAVLFGCGDDDPGRPRSEHWEVAGIWGRFGSGPGQLSLPLDLCVDSQGNILVANTGKNTVEKFSPNGTFLGNTQETLKLYFPASIECDASGRVYLIAGLAENPNSGLLILNSSLQLDRVTDYECSFMTTWHDKVVAGLRPHALVPGRGYDVVCFDSENRVFFRTAPDVELWEPIAGACGSAKAFVLNGPTSTMHVLDLHSLTWSEWDSSLAGVEDIYATEDNRVFVACKMSIPNGGVGGVYEFTTGGEFVEKVTNENTAIVRNASAVTMDRSGALYVLDFGNEEIVKLVRVAE